MVKFYNYLLAILLGTMVVSCRGGKSAEDDNSSEAGVELSAKNFPDAAFLNVCSRYDTDGDGFLSKDEIEEVRLIIINEGSAVKNLAGLEHFTSLEHLDLSQIQADTLRLPQITTLKELHCVNSSVSVIDLSNQSSLLSIVCSENSNLQSLKVGGCTSLSRLFCKNCSLDALDLKGLDSLAVLNCSYNKITRLDVSGHKQLTELNCRDNKIGELMVTGCNALVTIDCVYNYLKTLDVSDCKQLNYIRISGNDFEGDGIDAFINSLPNRGEVSTDEEVNRIEAKRANSPYDSFDNDEYKWTREQVDAARAKGWRIWDDGKDHYNATEL